METFIWSECGTKPCLKWESEAYIGLINQNSPASPHTEHVKRQELILAPLPKKGHCLGRRNHHELVYFVPQGHHPPKPYLLTTPSMTGFNKRSFLMWGCHWQIPKLPSPCNYCHAGVDIPPIPLSFKWSIDTLCLSFHFLNCVIFFVSFQHFIWVWIIWK